MLAPLRQVGNEINDLMLGEEFVQQGLFRHPRGQQACDESEGKFHAFDVVADLKTFPIARMRDASGLPSAPSVGWSQPPSSCSFQA